MGDTSTTTITATFDTREAADLAVERLVQQHGVARPDIFIQSATAQNTTGSSPSGGDISGNKDARDDAPLNGEIEVSVDIDNSHFAAVQRSLGEAGAVRVSGR